MRAARIVLGVLLVAAGVAVFFLLDTPGRLDGALTGLLIAVGVVTIRGRALFAGRGRGDGSRDESATAHGGSAR